MGELFLAEESYIDGSTKFLGFTWEQCSENVPVISTGQFFQPFCVFWCSLPFPSLFHPFIPLEVFRVQVEVQAGKRSSQLILPASAGNHYFALMPHVFHGNSPLQISREHRFCAWCHSWSLQDGEEGKSSAFPIMTLCTPLVLSFLTVLPMYETCLPSGCSFLLPVCKHCACFVQINLLKVYRNRNSLPATRNVQMGCGRIEPQAASGSRNVGIGLRSGEPQIWSTGAEHLGAKHIYRVLSVGAAL